MLPVLELLGMLVAAIGCALAVVAPLANAPDLGIADRHPRRSAGLFVLVRLLGAVP
jgi:hypothetical protein